MDRAKLARDHALATLRLRDQAAKFLDEARAAGDRREVRTWEAELRKFDKLIATYGLNRYSIDYQRH